MKTETLEMIIEELASALSLERWRAGKMEEELSKLRKENKELAYKLEQMTTKTTAKTEIKEEYNA